MAPKTPVEKKGKDAAADSASKKKPTRRRVTIRSKNLTYGTVKFRASLKGGKWHFTKKTEIKKKRQQREKDGITKEMATRKKKHPVIVKPIKGEKNGETRTIHLKRKNYYPVAKKPATHRARNSFSKHKRYTRASLVPGTVLILLAGVNKGKRVVLLKVLESGLLLVTGPFLLNAVPVRRVQQGHVIATKTKLDFSYIEIPEQLQDKYFKRVVEKKKVKKGEKTVFAPKKKTYKPDADRKSLQKDVDAQVLSVIKKHPQKKILYAYLAARFGLRNNQYPHRLQF